MRRLSVSTLVKAQSSFWSSFLDPSPRNRCSFGAARFCLPTPRGLCEALDLGVPATPEEEVAALPEVARALLDELEDMAALASPEFKDTASAMARGQWPWGDAVLAALGIDHSAKKPRAGAGLDVWKSLPQWEEPPPAPDPEDPYAYDLDDLEDAGPALVSPEQRLLEAFPGAEEVAP